jgi:anaerobic ribonucleoside-triphosphate reductase activating protein
VTVFFSGCNHHCEGCHNPLSHDFGNGRPFTDQIQTDLITYINDTPFIDGITLSGGDPMYSATAIQPFIHRLKQEVRGREISIWIYSGFTFEEIRANPIMNELLCLCDVLVDGPFMINKRGVNLSYKGSSNQRVIDIQASLADDTITLYGETT